MPVLAFALRYRWRYSDTEICLFFIYFRSCLSADEGGGLAARIGQSGAVSHGEPALRTLSWECRPSGSVSLSRPVGPAIPLLARQPARVWRRSLSSATRISASNSIGTIRA